MTNPSIIILIVFVLASIQIMRVIERISVEGWEDEEGFHLGCQDEADRG